MGVVYKAVDTSLHRFVALNLVARQNSAGHVQGSRKPTAHSFSFRAEMTDFFVVTIILQLHNSPRV